MKLPSVQELLELNDRALKYNEKIRPLNERITAEKEKRFIRSAAGGMFLMWNPYLAPEDKTATNHGKQEEEFTGLPVEIGQYIGSFFTKKDAAAITQVCKSAYSAANSDVSQFVRENGDVRKEIPLTPIYSLLF